MAAEAATPIVGPEGPSNDSATRRGGLSSMGGLHLGLKALLVIILAILTVRFVFALITPLPIPEGSDIARNTSLAPIDLTIFSRFDPFQGNAPAEETARPEVNASETQLALKLVGTYFSDTPSAIIQGGNGRQAVYRLGDNLGQNTTINEIRDNQVLLDRGGIIETLTLQNRDPKTVSSRVESSLTEALQQTSGIDEFIRFQMDQNSQAILLYPGQNDEIFEVAGLIEGDRLMAINGTPISSGGVNFAALSSQLQNGNGVQVTVERDGTPISLEISLEGLLP